MIIIEGIVYTHSGYSYCDQCKDTVCDGTNTSQQFKICIKGHKQYYGFNKPKSNIIINNKVDFLIL